MKTTKFLLLATALLSSVNCSAAPKTIAEDVNATVQYAANTQTVNENAAAESQAQKATAPDALVRDLYKQHDAQKSPFFQTKSRALVDKYFDKNLADMIWKDAKESEGEVGALGADPLYNAQDTNIKKFTVNQPKITGEKAEVVVTFDNYNEKQKLVYSLVKQSNEWRISDINYGEYTLIGLFKENAQAMTDSNSQTGEFEGKYQIGDTTCTVKPVKMAFEVRWEKGSGVEMFFSEGRANDRYIFASNPAKGKANSFAFDDENYNTGTFYRADGKEFPIKRIK